MILGELGLVEESWQKACAITDGVEHHWIKNSDR